MIKRIKARTKTFKKANGTATIKRDSYSNLATDWFSIRKAVYARDLGLCRSRIGNKVCGNKGVDVHHVIPLSKGGVTKGFNLITLCKACHKARHRHLR
jgi:5-methylcytosine-specific restriction endonuclease McrA